MVLVIPRALPLKYISTLPFFNAFCLQFLGSKADTVLNLPYHLCFNKSST
jgi:hypothetical protein